jgi:MoaA/NifB/PqqE/SkfB family radical SAM enzyme
MAIVTKFVDTKRTNLRDVIPLSSPFYIGIEPTRMCNLKCFFCQHSTRETKDDRFEKKSQQIKHISTELFEKIINDIYELPVLPKRISLMGMGEPTLNPDLCSMVSKLRSKGFDAIISTYTNGTTLTDDLINDLCSTGLTRLQISVYGLNADDYNKFSGVRIDFQNLLDNIRKLFEKKSNLQIRIKTTDDVADTDERKQLFYETFSEYCDQISIEHIINIPVQMGNALNINRDITQFCSTVTKKRSVCPWMFYQSHISVDGDVFCCDILAKPREYSLGNLYEKSFSEIWNGKKRTELLCQSLRDGHNKVDECKDCDDIYSVNQSEEELDDCRLEMLERIKKVQYENS